MTHDEAHSSPIAHPPPKLKHVISCRTALSSAQHRHVCLVMVGLPGRGKSFIARKLEVFMKWKDGGLKVRLFNVGMYRRHIGESAGAAFFDPSNTDAVSQRQQAAADAMNDMLRFFDNGGEVSIFDATNSTHERRQWILEQCRSKGVPTVFIESICDDPEVLEENFLNKVRHSPDFANMDPAAAMADLCARVQNYEKVYETITDDALAYIKLYNLQSKVMCNRATGRLTQALLPFLTSIHIAPRPIWLCRSGLPVGIQKEEDHNPCAECPVSPMSDLAEKFALALREFTKVRMAIYLETIESANSPVYQGHFERCVTRQNGVVDRNATCKVMVSTMSRSADTCRHLDNVEIEAYAQLNPLDKGIYEGMSLAEIQHKDPEFWTLYQQDRLHMRFPGGESYADMMSRLEPCLIEAEQQTAPVLVVGHVTTLQVLYAYYRQVPISQAMRVRIEPHTVYELSPLMGGMWNVTIFKLDLNSPTPALKQVVSQPATPVDPASPWSPIAVPCSPIPAWGR